MERFGAVDADGGTVGAEVGGGVILTVDSGVVLALGAAVAAGDGAAVAAAVAEATALLDSAATCMGLTKVFEGAFGGGVASLFILARTCSAAWRFPIPSQP